MSAERKKGRGERFVSRPGDSVFVKPGEQPRRGQPPTTAGAALELGEIRRARNVTQAELAIAMGVDQAQVSRLESRGDFRWSSVLEYLRGLGVTDAQLKLTFDDGSQAVMPVGEKR